MKEKKIKASDKKYISPFSKKKKNIYIYMWKTFAFIENGQAWPIVALLFWAVCLFDATI